ncbi:hypothetical protein WICPIJ_006826 [Wickerhamomyces pijperi]|uniref:FH2 domain-containing protein n=1 Tax=Wickerhamomyces pijperi TaxID=599730 RepID=A0A9P8TKM7_WICPI|nr:hypothetical protein WICPIJ_006826 [Wickerhamomyces pijperi]
MMMNDSAVSTNGSSSDLPVVSSHSPIPHTDTSDRQRREHLNYKFPFTTIPKAKPSITPRSGIIRRNEGKSLFDPIVLDEEEDSDNHITDPVSFVKSPSTDNGLETKFLTYDRTQPPADHIVESLFISFLQRTAFGQQTKDNLTRQSITRKWALICLDFHSNLQNQQDEKQMSQRKSTEPSWFLSRAKMLTEMELHRLERMLRSERFSLQFLKDDGHIVLLRDVDRFSVPGDVEFLVINCVKNCLNFEFGFEYCNNEDLFVLRSMIDIMVKSAKLLNQLNVAEILLMICDWKVPLGRNNLLKAFNQLHHTDSNLFAPWIKSLQNLLTTDHSNILTITRNTIHLNYLAKSVQLMTSLLKNCEAVNDQKIIHMKLKELDIYALFSKMREFKNAEINNQIEGYKALELEIFSSEILNELSLGDTNLDILLKNLRSRVGSNPKDELFQLQYQIIKQLLHILTNQTRTESVKFFKLISNLVDTVSDATNYKIVNMELHGTEELIQGSIKVLMDKLSSEDLTKRALRELDEAESRNESLELEIKSLKSANSLASDSPMVVKLQELEEIVERKDREIESLREQVRQLTNKNLNRGGTMKPAKFTHHSKLLQSLNRRAVSLSSAAHSRDDWSGSDSFASSRRSRDLLSRRSSTLSRSKSGITLQHVLQASVRTNGSSESFESLGVSQLGHGLQAAANTESKYQLNPNFKPQEFTRQDSITSSSFSGESADISQGLSKMVVNNESFESINVNFDNFNRLQRFNMNQPYSVMTDIDELNINPTTNEYSSTVIPLFLQESKPERFFDGRDEAVKLGGYLSANSSMESIVMKDQDMINFHSKDPKLFRPSVDLHPSHIPVPVSVPELTTDDSTSSSSDPDLKSQAPSAPVLPDFLNVPQFSDSICQSTQVNVESSEPNSLSMPLRQPPPPPSLPAFLLPSTSTSSDVNGPSTTSSVYSSFNSFNSGDLSKGLPPPPPPPSLPDFFKTPEMTRPQINISITPAPPISTDLLRLNQSMPELDSTKSSMMVPPPPPPPSLPIFLQSGVQGSAPPPPPPPPPPPGLLSQSKPTLKTHSKKLSGVLTPEELQQITNSFSPHHQRGNSITKKPTETKKKLKQLHWDQVDTVEDTIWDTSASSINKVEELKELGVFQEIESLFPLKESNIKKPINANSMNASSEADKDQKITVLPRDLSQQFGINLHMFANYSDMELVSKVLHCHPEVLENVSVLEFFQKDDLCSVPSTLMKKFQPYVTDYSKGTEPQEDPTKLDRSDRIFLELCVNLRHYWRSRARALLVIRTYERDYYDLLTKLQKVDDSIKAIKQSENLKSLFLLLREIGNFMNRKPVEGFKLASLSKLGFIKDVGNKGTFLHYVERVIRKMYPEYLGFLQELSLLSETAKINIDQLSSDVATFTASVRNINRSIKEGNLSNPAVFHPEDLILMKIQPKLPEAIQRCEMLENQHKFIIKQDFVKLMKYFSENSNDANSRNTFLTKFLDFMRDFKKVQMDNIKTEEQLRIQEKRRIQREFNKAQKSKKSKSSLSKCEEEDNEDDHSDLVFENLIKKLKSTKLVNNSERRRTSVGLGASGLTVRKISETKPLLRDDDQENEVKEVMDRAKQMLKETQGI